MKASAATLLAIATLWISSPGLAQVSPRQGISEAIIAKVLSENSSEAAAAIAQLRAQGPVGLKVFLQANRLPNNPVAMLPNPQLRKALDTLCQQRDCHASQLYWYTDLEQAKAAAKASGKPILSLRLLGKLDEELSCANSRFFRTALYPNAEVSQVLRDRFILHWQSVRPVPKITIDFGDGRKLERTLTGNSIHYVLDANGKPIDALPGLYGPQAFLRQLQQAEQANQQVSQLAPEAQTVFLQQYHRDRLNQLQTKWQADLKKLNIQLPNPISPIPAPRNADARQAGQIAVTKSIAESPLVSATLVAQANQQQLTNRTDEAAWQKLAQLHAQDARLDRNSQALMQSKNPQVGSNLLAVVQKFEAAMAMDTVRNEYLLHAQLHQWFISVGVTPNVDSLNERVYAELFLTPSSDPWLGLLPGDGYTAIENEGVLKAN